MLFNFKLCLDKQQEMINFGQRLPTLLLYTASNVGENLLPWQLISAKLPAIHSNSKTQGQSSFTL
jgi:hypothetical protein